MVRRNLLLRKGGILILLELKLAARIRLAGWSVRATCCDAATVL